MATRQRVFGRFSQPEQKSRDQRLRSAWLAVPDPLHSRPEPRGVWDSAARADCPTSPWERTVDPLRAALRAAVRTGSADKVRAVTLRIEAFMDAMAADVLSVNPVRDEASILLLAIEETEIQAAADVAVMEVVAASVPCPVKLEKAEQALTQHENAIRRCKTMVGSLLRNGIRPQLTVAR